MKGFLKYLSVLFCLVLLGGCSEQVKEVDGEFLLGQFGTDWKKETYHVVVPIQWTGDSPITLKSIEFVKDYPDPLTTYEEDGIKYEIFGADPLRRTGIHGETYDRELKNIKGLEINGEGKIVIKLSLGDVKADKARRLKIKFDSDGEEVEKIVVWKTLEQITTENR
ncbi:hypothetical protein [Lysinibacillus fusiformis]|uniref:hypothetical protein n=1 Tax=Lysinibacillus fusiformis TaxID=28031 RepID=UPI003815D1EC